MEGAPLPVGALPPPVVGDPHDPHDRATDEQEKLGYVDANLL